MLQFSSSEKRLVKSLKKNFLDPILTEKGHYRGHAQYGQKLFGRKSKSGSSAFRKFLSYQNIILSKYHMFWLRYKSFSIWSWVMFSVKSVISRTTNSCVCHTIYQQQEKARMLASTYNSFPSSSVKDVTFLAWKIIPSLDC